MAVEVAGYVNGFGTLWQSSSCRTVQRVWDEISDRVVSYIVAGYCAERPSWKFRLSCATQHALTTDRHAKGMHVRRYLDACAILGLNSEDWMQQDRTLETRIRVYMLMCMRWVGWVASREEAVWCGMPRSVHPVVLSMQEQIPADENMYASDTRARSRACLIHVLRESGVALTASESHMLCRLGVAMEAVACLTRDAKQVAKVMDEQSYDDMQALLLWAPFLPYSGMDVFKAKGFAAFLALMHGSGGRPGEFTRTQVDMYENKLPLNERMCDTANVQLCV